MMMLPHSPLVGVESWGRLPEALGRGGVSEDRAMAEAFRAELEQGSRFPEWGDAELAPLVPDPAARAALIGSLRPRGLAFFTEPLPPAALLALAARM